MASIIHMAGMVRDVLGQRNPGQAGGNGGDSLFASDSAGMTRAMFRHFQQTYKPVEDQVMASAFQTDFSKEGDEAGAIAGKQVAASRSSLARELRRRGASLNAEERAGLDRRMSLAGTKAIAGTENITRRMLSDSRYNMLQAIVGIGRGVSSSARGAAGTVADLAAQRQMQYDNAKASYHGQKVSTGASLAALAIAAI